MRSLENAPLSVEEERTSDRTLPNRYRIPRKSPLPFREGGCPPGRGGWALYRWSLGSIWTPGAVAGGAL
jgi:hypothetical protein